MLALARKRVPEADLRRGDMQFLPYEDDFFDVVAGFNSFFFAADMVAALHEAGRVAKPGVDISWAYEYSDEDALARALLAAGGIVEAMAPCRTADGGYRLDNDWHYLLTSS